MIKTGTWELGLDLKIGMQVDVKALFTAADNRDISFTPLFLHNDPLQWTDLLDIDRIWHLTVIVNVMAP